VNLTLRPLTDIGIADEYTHRLLSSFCSQMMINTGFPGLTPQEMTRISATIFLLMRLTVVAVKICPGSGPTRDNQPLGTAASGGTGPPP